MKQKKQKLTKKQKQRRERTFMHASVILSTLLMIVLALVAANLYRTRDARLMDKARGAMQNGDYALAEIYLEKVISSGSQRGESAAGEAEDLLLECRYMTAQRLLDAGRYEEAETAFSALGDYGDSRERIKECRYRSADALEQAGRYEEAAEAFFALSGYSDSLTRYDSCRFQYAGELENAGRTEDAFALYRLLGSYPGAEEKATALAMKMTGASDPELALQLAEGYSPEEIAVIERLFSLRASLPQNAIAVGFYHTVGLREDGTVASCGRNEEGQCDTGSWTGITAVAAGAYHTAGLRENGTVVCCGRNKEHQCDTEGWTDIIAVACTDYGTVGLKKDGTAVYTGFESGTGVAGWQDVKALGAGSYIILGIRGGGALLSTHPGAAMGDRSGLVAAKASTGYALALTQEGAVLFTGGETGWSDCVSISASSTGFAAVTADGRVLTRWFEARDAIDFSDITDAADVAVGGTHTAVLLRNGRVVCRGSNAYGECDTDGFMLRTAGTPAA